jgi:small subunit ribosomal protein S1
VTRMTSFGAFVELDEGIEGLIHVSEFDDTHGGEKIVLEAESKCQVKIIKLSPQERKIGLSIRALNSDDYRTDWEVPSEAESTGTATLGDHFKNR